MVRRCRRDCCGGHAKAWRARDVLGLDLWLGRSMGCEVGRFLLLPLSLPPLIYPVVDRLPHPGGTARVDR